MAAENPKIHAIYRYPVKGLSPEPLARTHLAVGATLPADRLYAIENGPSGFDLAAPRHFPKQRYLMLMRNERLARLRTRFDDTTHTLAIEQDSREAARGDLRTPGGRAAVERFFAHFCADELRGAPKVLHAPGFSFSDVAAKVVSIINLATVAAVENAVGVPVHPLRFRGNLYVSGWPAWGEFDLLGREITVGKSARLKIVKRIVRCAATNVDPDTGIRDLSIPQTLMRSFGHADCGVYGEVAEAGDIAVGDELSEGACLIEDGRKRPDA
jgi:MOSC domain-containing protein